MENIKKLKLNSISSLLNQIVIIISGFIVPRYILLYFGSDTNGLVSSTNQFLSIISFLELGVGAVVQSSLYKPIAKNDFNQINEILATARLFFRLLAKILVVYILILLFVFPYIVDSPYNFIDTSVLIVAMSISLFSQYYFGVVNQLLLNADQKIYIHVTVQIITVVLNTVATVILITQGFSIQVVRLATSAIFLLRPIYINHYVKKTYSIDYNIKPNKNSIPQLWNGIAQHIASVVLNSTDMVLLSLFSTLENVSIYAVYNMVVNGVKLMITSLTSGMQSFFGKYIANNKIVELNGYFSKIEWLIHNLVVYIFGLAIVLINSFVLIYTDGVTDADYYRPVFSFIITLGQGVYCLRLPYNSMVLAGGHYKQTQTSAIIEAAINVVLSLFLVNRVGLVGVAIGTVVAMLYRTVYLAYYLSDNIINRSFTYFIKQISTDLLIFILMLLLSNIVENNPVDILTWILTAVKFSIIFFVISFFINYFVYKENVIYYLKDLKIVK